MSDAVILAQIFLVTAAVPPTPPPPTGVADAALLLDGEREKKTGVEKKTLQHQATDKRGKRENSHKRSNFPR